MKNASDSKESCRISSTDGTSGSSCSMVSMETATMRVDAESAAATVLLQADDSVEKGGSMVNRAVKLFKFVLFNCK